MKRFRFHLAGLELLRESEAETAMELLHEAAGRRRVVEDRLAMATERHSLLNASMSSDYKQPWARSSFLSFLADSSDRIEHIKRDLKAHQEKEEQLLGKYLTAKQNLDTVLELKKRKKQQHDQAMLKKEEQEAEDIFNGRYVLEMDNL